MMFRFIFRVIATFMVLYFFSFVLFKVHRTFNISADVKTLSSKKQLTHLITSNPNPIPSSKSILIAMKIFSIEGSKKMGLPSYDPSLKDRGQTVISEGGKPCQVKVGTSAFQSWGVLGATLAHEIEVHCNQDITFIKAFDLFGGLGTYFAERAAYKYEIDSKKRFGLATDEVKSIRETMDYYFPKKW